jgi:p-aminobenzoyl-glutamate transporter AbgT
MVYVPKKGFNSLCTSSLEICSDETSKAISGTSIKDDTPRATHASIATLIGLEATVVPNDTSLIDSSSLQQPQIGLYAGIAAGLFILIIILVVVLLQLQPNYSSSNKQIQ